MFDDAGLIGMPKDGLMLTYLPLMPLSNKAYFFNRAYRPNAKCVPSLAACIYGRNSRQRDATPNHVFYFHPKFKNYQEALLEICYTLRYTGKGRGHVTNCGKTVPKDSVWDRSTIPKS